MGLIDGVKGALGGGVASLAADVAAAAERTIDGAGGGRLAMAFAKFHPGGLPDFLDRLRGAGHGAAVESWLGGGESRPVPAAAIAACLPEAVTERFAEDLGLPRERVPTALAEFLPAAVAGESEGGRLRPQPSFSTQVG